MRAAPFVTLPALLFIVAPLHAEPEWNVAAQTSLCGLGEHGQLWHKTAFCGAIRGDLLFGRERNADFALGPYATLGTAKFADARFGAGLSLLLPTFSGDFPVLLSAGGLSRNGSDARLSAEMFFGLRSHNFHGAYAMASGLVLGGDSALNSGHANTVYVGLQVDGLWIALPFILGYEWLHGTPDPGD
ncbi:MAG TPA: hypothetical protein VGF76_06385 [Polyangiaceae bacterium]